MNSILIGLLPSLSVPLPFGALAEKPTLVESEGFILVGFLLVLAVLFLLYLVCLLLGFFFTRYERQQKKNAASAAGQVSPAAVAPIDDGSNDQRIAAIISAAVHVALGSSARVIRIHPVFSDEWAREGRRRHFASHKLR